MSGSAICKRCGRPIVWATDARDKNVPLDPAPCIGGDLVLEATGIERGHVLFAVRPAKPTDVKRYRSHHVTCPKNKGAA